MIACYNHGTAQGPSATVKNNWCAEFLEMLALHRVLRYNTLGYCYKGSRSLASSMRSKTVVMLPVNKQNPSIRNYCCFVPLRFKLENRSVALRVAGERRWQTHGNRFR